MSSTGGDGGDGGDITEVVLDGGDPPGREVSSGISGGRIAVAVAALALVVAVVVGAASLLGPGDNEPTDAVQDLLDALGDGDLVGVGEAMSPGEREFLVEPMVDVFDEMKRLGVLSDDADASDLAGYELDWEDVTFEVEEVADDLAVVRITGGTFSAVVDPAEIPLGDLILSRVPGGTIDEEPAVVDDEPIGDAPPLAVVREDGRWYVSLFHSIGEQARRDAGAGRPGEPLASVGADSPEAAVENLLAAAVDLDLGGVIARLAPDESAALRRYAPLFLGEVDEAADEARAAMDDAGVEMSYDVDVTEVEGDRGTFVEVTSVVADVITDEGALHYEVSDGCTVFELTAPDMVPERFEQCGTTETQLEMLPDELRPPVLDQFLEIDLSGIRVVEQDGGWYVAPVRTGWDNLLDMTAPLTREGIDETVDWAMALAADPAAMEEALFELFGSMGALGGPMGGLGTGPDPFVVDPGATS